VHGGQRVLPHDLGEGTAGEDEFAGGGQLAVLVGEGEGAEPGLVTGFESGVPHQPQHGVGEFFGVRGVLVPGHAGPVVQGGGDGGPHLRGGEDGARGGG